MLKIRYLIHAAVLAIVAILSQGAANCQQSGAPGPKRASSADTEMLLAGGEQTVVTASRKVQKVRDVPSAVTIITEEEIHASGARTVIDLLRYVPGLDVFESNSTVANVSSRSFNKSFANGILVMVDGRSIYQDLYGGVYWNTVPLLLSRIKRIEVVRGPGSVLFGANAFNGVINIITKTPLEMEAAPAKTSLRALAGEYNTYNVEVQTTTGKPNDFAVSVGAAGDGSIGFGKREPGQARDSYTMPVLTLDVQKQFRRGNLLMSAGNADATADFSQDIFAHDANWHTNYLDIGYSEDKGPHPFSLRGYFNSTYVTTTNAVVQEAETSNFEAQQQVRLSRQHMLVYGANVRESVIRAPELETGDHHFGQYSGFVQDDIRLGAHTQLFAGARYDQDTAYGNNLSPRFSLIHHPDKQQTVRLSTGTAFRAPSAIELYLNTPINILPNATTQILGNPHIRPESITSYELGYRRDLPNGHVAINSFYNVVAHKIDLVTTSTFPSPPYPAGVPSVLQYANTSGGEYYGFELESELQPARGVRLLLNYSFQDKAPGGALLTDLAPKHKFNFLLSGPLGGNWEGFLGGHINGTASTFYDGTNSNVPIPAYFRMDARIGYRFGPTGTTGKSDSDRSSIRPWMASIAVSNLLGADHQEYPVALNNPASLSAARQKRMVYFLLEGKF